MRKAFISACSSGLVWWPFSASASTAPPASTMSAANGWLPSWRERRARAMVRRSNASSVDSGKAGLATHLGARRIVALDERAELQAADGALLHHCAPIDHRQPRARRGAGEQSGDDVAVRAGVFQPVDAKGDQVGGLAGFERADLVAPEQRGAAQGGELERLACRRSEERRVGKECRSRWSPYH